MQRILPGLATLIGCLLAGEWLAARIDIGLPGSVIGMLLLLLLLGGMALAGRPVPDSLNRTSDALLSVLALLFLPAAAGVFFLPEEIVRQWLPIAAAMVFGTLISLVISAVLLHWMLRRSERDD
ncbi:CidA/LrgA family protein [Biformimicrobium ophioploci]|uniref:CidA/LrgA family protein n=1 Tax=Biformimicrobium ophioploci TaxID=3036711 RepID=A0ABQ6LVY5_9GAMM|nr:CidA/LrgA family protein [Microbulbifer sp. NKW57]GMG86197.1 CidA/LrgA family protein [Microbulbifer sp. NKW57]